MDKRIISEPELYTHIQALYGRIARYSAGRTIRLWGVPRGGAHVVTRLIAYSAGVESPLVKLVPVINPELADVIIDDLTDSGATCLRFKDKYPETPFVVLVQKEAHEWVEFPWETDELPAEDNIRRLLQAIGENPSRGGLLETPARVAKAWQFWTKGYNQDPAAILKVFEDGAENYDQMVTVKDIPIYSHCEHHMAAIFGTATISYIPNGKIVGLSKLSRLAEVFARRLQVQERLTNQIADAIQENLQPKGVGVVVKARHLCMESRGICQQGHHTVTTALRGCILTETDARSEFMAIAM